MLVWHSLLDLVYDGVAITDDMVGARGDAIALAFTEQAREALDRLGEVPERLTVRESELYQDLRGILDWNDHGARLSVHLGHGLPARLAFSTRTWERMRLVVVACVGPGSSVRVYAIVGSLFTSECDEGGGDAWTAWLLVYKNHAVSMRLADSVFTGEVGASRFLRSLPCFGIAPVTMGGDLVARHRGSEGSWRRGRAASARRRPSARRLGRRACRPFPRSGRRRRRRRCRGGGAACEVVRCGRVDARAGDRAVVPSLRSRRGCRWRSG